MKVTQEQLQQLKSDSRYLAIGDLPSLYIPYDYAKDDFLIRPFELAELRLLSRAKALGDIKSFLRAIDMVITVPAENLTMGDLYYVMMWIKIHSYTKTPILVDWTCTSSYLKHKQDGTFLFTDTPRPEKFDPTQYDVIQCKTSNTRPITNQSLEIVELPEGFKLTEGLDYPRASTLIDIDDFMQNPETVGLVAGALWMPGSTVEEKFKYMEENFDFALLQAGIEASRKVVHGIKQACTLSCRVCNTKYPYVIDLEPLNFFL